MDIPADAFGLSSGSKDRDRENSMNITMNSRVAAITGGSKGLGLAMARQFAASGAKVAILARGAADLKAARELVTRRYFPNDVLGLRHQGDVFYAYRDERGAYHARDKHAMRADVYGFLETAQTWHCRTLLNKP